MKYFAGFLFVFYTNLAGAIFLGITFVVMGENNFTLFNLGFVLPVFSLIPSILFWHTWRFIYRVLERKPKNIEYFIGTFLLVTFVISFVSFLMPEPYPGEIPSGEYSTIVYRFLPAAVFTWLSVSYFLKRCYLKRVIVK